MFARVSHDSSKPMDLPTVSEVSPNFLRVTSRPEAPVHDGLPGNTAWIPRTRDLFFSAPLRLSASVAVLALSWSPPDQQGALRDDLAAGVDMLAVTSCLAGLVPGLGLRVGRSVQQEHLL